MTAGECFRSIRQAGPVTQPVPPTQTAKCPRQDGCDAVLNRKFAMANLMRMCAAVWMLAACAASAVARPRPTSPPDQNAPAQFDLQAQTQGQTLSERLDRSNGVIRPRNVDPEMRVPPPATADKMPVVPPPGSPGGDSSVKPK